jgi:4-diphosphocytidyl-2C-methyl-D-erythritol kinase
VIAQTAFNRFEEAVFALQPRTAEVAKRVNALGAIFTQMSGSGPTLVGYFSDVREAQQAREILAEEGISSYVCHAIAKNA